MTTFYEKWPNNFGALDVQDFDKAKVVVIPVRYDATLSYKSGSKEGPEEIITASRFIDEMLPDESGKNMLVLKSTDIFTTGLIVPSINPEEAHKGIKEAIANEAVKHGKIPLMLGGEHSITLGAVKAVKEKYADLSVLHFDAHTDLMDKYEDSKFSHACVMRRIREEGVKTVSIGIRNANYETAAYIEKEKPVIFPAPQIPSIDQVLPHLSQNVYLTFDLDAFDPSIMPSVGTPEPGGLYWHETIKFIEEIAKKVNIVGADVVELMPIPGLHAPNFLAAKLAYNIAKNIIIKK